MEFQLPDQIQASIVIRAPREKVFAAISQPDLIVQWFPDAFEGSIAVGERPVLDFGKYGKCQIYIEALEAPSYFAYRWVSGSVNIPHGFQGDVLSVPHTLVEFRLSEVPGGTLITLTESGFSSLLAEVYTQTLKDNSEGWPFMLDRLQKYLS